MVEYHGIDGKSKERRVKRERVRVRLEWSGVWGVKKIVFFNNIHKVLLYFYLPRDPKYSGA